MKLLDPLVLNAAVVVEGETAPNHTKDQSQKGKWWVPRNEVDIDLQSVKFSPQDTFHQGEETTANAHEVIENKESNEK